MQIIDLKIKKLLDEIESYEKENDMSKEQREIFDKIFQRRINNLNGHFDSNAIHYAILETKFNNADKFCFEILPQFDKGDKKEGTIFAHFYYEIMRYASFSGNTKSEIVAKGFNAISQFVWNFKGNLTYEQYKKEAYKLLNGNKVDLIKHFFLYSNLDAPTSLIEEMIERTDSYLMEHEVYTLNGAINYHIKETQMAQLNELIGALNNEIFENTGELEQDSTAPIIDNYFER